MINLLYPCTRADPCPLQEARLNQAETLKKVRSPPCDLLNYGTILTDSALLYYRSSRVRHAPESRLDGYASPSVPAHLSLLRYTAVKELVTDANFDCTDEGIVRPVSWRLRSSAGEQNRADAPSPLIAFPPPSRLIRCSRYVEAPSYGQLARCPRFAPPRRCWLQQLQV